MHAELGFPLEWSYIKTAPVSFLVREIKTWIKRTNPICLMHPHGFLVTLLGQDQKGEWRFHLWPTGARPNIGMPAKIHTHNKHIESRVLQGEINNVLYTVKRATFPIGDPLYEVDYCGDRYRAETTNSLRRTDLRVVATPQSYDTITKGEIYQINRDLYHEARISEEHATATLVYMHNASASPVRVIGIDGYPDSLEFERTKVNWSIFIDQLMDQ